MRARRLLLCGGVWLALAGGLSVAQQAAPELPPELRIAPDTNPMPSMEVVTVRKTDGKPLTGLMVTTMKPYLLEGFGIPESRLVGAPSWLGSQPWVVNGKPPDELRDAEKKMTPEQRRVVGQMLRRSVLRDQFKLKAHVETRKMEYFELVPAKGGLKIKEVPAFVPPAPGTPLPPFVPGVMRPGMMMIQNKDGIAVVNARAITLSTLLNLIAHGPEVGGRPVVDKTGFKGSFDVVDMPFGGMMMGGMNAGAAAPTDVQAPSMFTTLQEMFGLKLVATKGPVEVLVIDSIEEPTEN